MNSNDHLKWMIGDMTFQIAQLQGKIDELEAKLNQQEVKFVPSPESSTKS